MSKFQIVKGITDNLSETPYVEGKVYFVYDNTESQNITIYADIDNVRRKIKEGVQSDELDDYLLKTDIANWAKEATKPTYTAAEVGALPNTTVIPEDKVFIATYGTTTYADTLAAYNAEKLIFAVRNNGQGNGKIIIPLTRYNSSFFQFEGQYLGGLTKRPVYYLQSSGWTAEDTYGNIITRNVDITSGDRLIIRDVDDNNTTKSSSLTFGTETNQYLANNGTWQTIPESTSDLTNDSGFQTSTEVNSAIATAIGNINQFNVAIVSTLPTENIDDHTIYFMSNGGSDDSIYDEWMYINNDWEKIGTTAVDLSGYMQTSHPANGITSTDISNWNKKSNLWAVGSKKSGDDYYWTLAVSQNSLWDLNNTPGSNSGIGYITLPVSRNGNVYKNVQLQLPITSGTIALTSDIPTVPTTISSFTNDSGYLTLADLPIYDGTVV